MRARNASIDAKPNLSNLNALSPNMTTEKKFWRWFLEHEDELFSFEGNQEAIFNRLADALHKVDPDLTFEFGPNRDGVREVRC